MTWHIETLNIVLDDRLTEQMLRQLIIMTIIN